MLDPARRVSGRRAAVEAFEALAFAKASAQQAGGPTEFSPGREPGVAERNEGGSPGGAAERACGGGGSSYASDTYGQV